MIRQSKFRAWSSQRPAFDDRFARGLTFIVALGLLSYAHSSIAAEGKTAVLTEQRPTASISLGATELKTETPILEVDVTELSNPAMVPLGIAVSLTDGIVKVPVGSFAFYPADHGGIFSLDCAAALAQIGRGGHPALIYELRKLRPSAEWKPVRVVIAAPRWRSREE